MTVAKLNTAKGLRRSDKWPRAYILSNSENSSSFVRKPGQSDYRLESEFVYKTVPIGIISPAVSTFVRIHKPLRKIVARTPVRTEYRPNSGYFLTHYLDTLSCGHQITTYSGEESKRKRGCQECLDAQIAAKKPVQSIGKKVA